MTLPLNHIHVLVVENDLGVTDALWPVLRLAGATVLGACATVADALTTLNTLPAPPDVALLDIELDDGAVFPVAHWLRDHHLPFVFVSGAPSLIPKALDDVAVLMKPVSAANVIAQLVASVTM